MKQVSITVLLLLLGCQPPDKKLDEALFYGDAAQARAALAAGADPNKGALHKAVRTRLEVLRVVLEFKADPNLPWPGYASGELPLELALSAWSQHLERVRLLLDAGADPNRSRPGRPPPLLEALASGLEDCALLLLERGADPKASHRGRSALDLALGDERRRSLKAFDALLAKGAGAGRSAALAIATSQGDRALLEQLLARPGLDPAVPFQEKGALAWAAGRGDLSAMRLLLDHGAKPDASAGQEGPLHAAARAGQAAAMKLLLDLKADPKVPDQSQATALHGAASAEVIRLLLAAGVPVDAPDKDGDTPLSWALELDLREPVAAESADAAPSGHEAVEPPPLALTLLAAGAQPDRPDSQGLRPLHVALAKKDYPTFLQLLALKASVRATRPGEPEPLAHLFDKHRWRLGDSAGVTPFAKALLERGVPIDAGGRNLLAVAVSYGEPSLAAVLLDHGADPATVEKLVATTTKKLTERTGNWDSISLGYETREVPDPSVAAAKTPRDRVIAAAAARYRNAREEARGPR